MDEETNTNETPETKETKRGRFMWVLKLAGIFTLAAFFIWYLLAPHTLTAYMAGYALGSLLVTFVLVGLLHVFVGRTWLSILVFLLLLGANTLPGILNRIAEQNRLPDLPTIDIEQLQEGKSPEQIVTDFQQAVLDFTSELDDVWVSFMNDILVEQREYMIAMLIYDARLVQPIVDENEKDEVYAAIERARAALTGQAEFLRGLEQRLETYAEEQAIATDKKDAFTAGLRKNLLHADTQKLVALKQEEVAAYQEFAEAVFRYGEAGRLEESFLQMPEHQGVVTQLNDIINQIHALRLEMDLPGA